MTTIWGPVGQEQWEEAGAQVDEEGYPSWTNAELSAELEARGLPKSGNKDELIARLEEDDGAS